MEWCTDGAVVDRVAVDTVDSNATVTERCVEFGIVCSLCSVGSVDLVPKYDG